MGCQNSKSSSQKYANNNNNSPTDKESKLATLNTKKCKPFNFNDSDAFILQKMKEIEEKRRNKKTKSQTCVEPISKQQIILKENIEKKKKSEKEIDLQSSEIDIKTLKNAIKNQKNNTLLQDVENSSLMQQRRSFSNLNTSSQSHRNKLSPLSDNNLMKYQKSQQQILNSQSENNLMKQKSQEQPQYQQEEEQYQQQQDITQQQQQKQQGQQFFRFSGNLTLNQNTQRRSQFSHTIQPQRQKNNTVILRSKGNKSDTVLVKLEGQQPVYNFSHNDNDHVIIGLQSDRRLSYRY